MKKLWISFAVVFVLSFAVLGWIGTRIYQEMPPIPARDRRHRRRRRGRRRRHRPRPERLAGARRHGSRLDLGPRQLCRPGLDGRLAASRSDLRARLIGRQRRIGKPYEQLIGGRTGKTPRPPGRDVPPQRLRCRLQHDRDRTGSRPRVRSLLEALLRRLHQGQSGLCHSARQRVSSAGTHAAVCRVSSSGPPGRRPRIASGDHISYTNNWPYEPLVGNRPTGDSVMWTGVSIIMLLAGICAMVWWYASQKAEEMPKAAACRPIRWARWVATPSQRATLKYFWVVSALILVQILMGDHYGPLRRGGRRFLRHQDLRHSALQRDADLARAGRHLLDRDGMAGGRAVHRTAGQR